MMVMQSFHSYFQALENQQSELSQRQLFFDEKKEYWSEYEVQTFVDDLRTGIRALIYDLILFRDELIDRSYQTRMVRMYLSRIEDMIEHLDWMYDELRGIYHLYSDDEE